MGLTSFDLVGTSCSFEVKGEIHAGKEKLRSCGSDAETRDPRGQIEHRCKAETPWNRSRRSVSCEGGMAPLAAARIEPLLAQVPGWRAEPHTGAAGPHATGGSPTARRRPRLAWGPVEPRWVPGPVSASERASCPDGRTGACVRARPPGARAQCREGPRSLCLMLPVPLPPPAAAPLRPRVAQGRSTSDLPCSPLRGRSRRRQGRLERQRRCPPSSGSIPY